MTDRAEALFGGEIEEQETLAIIEELPEDRRRFVLEFMRTRDLLRAYRAAGWNETYSNPGKRGAITFAKNRLRDDDIREALQSLENLRVRRLAQNNTRIKDEIAKVAFVNLSRFLRVQDDGTATIDFSRADEADFAGISSFKCEIEYKPGDAPDDPRQVLKQDLRLGNKMGALDLLSKIHKLVPKDDALDAIHDIADAIKAGRRRAGLKEPE